MNTQFRKGVIEMCVLSLIDKKDMYGYEIVQTIATYIDISEGTIYPILRRLTGDGYSKTYLKESSSGPARKYYSITSVGKIFLDDLKSDWRDINTMVNTIFELEMEELV